MKIYIANDHGGYDLKKTIMVELQKKGIWVVNEGSDSRDIVRYPYYASKVATAVSCGEADFGILICNTGIGMSMIANKYKNVRAGLAYSTETACLTRKHNNANVLCLGGKYLDSRSALKIVDAFINTEYEGGRHDISLNLIKCAENENITQNCWNEYDLEKKNYRDDFYNCAPKSPVNILLDTDMLTDCDDVAALAMLLQLEKQKKANILAVTVSSSYPASAAVVDVVDTYFGRSDIPIGAPKNGTGFRRDDSCFLDKLSDEFPHRLKDNDSAEDAVCVMRRALANSKDNSVKLVSIGYMSNICGLLKSEPDEISPLSGKSLVRQKVCEWVCMAGNFPDDPAIDNVNFTRDSAPALYAVRNFSGRITFVGRDIGHNIYVGDSFHKLLKDNPVRRAYELHRGRYSDNWNHHTADPSTVLYAVFGLSDYFEVQTGTITLHDDCSFEWNPDEKSNMSYLLQKADRRTTAKIIDDIITKS